MVNEHYKKTSALRAGQSPEQWAYRAIVPPIYMTTNYAQPTPGISDYEYSRSSNPTRNSLEMLLASLENAKYGLSFCSGLSALTDAVFLLKTGDHILCCDDVYGGVYRFLVKCAPKMGITYTFVDGTTVESWTENFQVGKTKMIWIESPTNPTMKIIDVRKVVPAVKALDKTCIIVVDNTFMSPVFSSPLALGADIVMHSCTKYINGHSDVIMGALMTNNREIYETLKFNQNALGVVPSPFDCSQVIRSIKTLQIRVLKQAESAMLIAKFLDGHKCVEKTHYPGLKSHPQHELAAREFSGFGGMISITLKLGKGDEGVRVVARVKNFHCAVSLGCVNSLIQIPSLMTHSAIDEKVRLKLGMTNNFLRLSIGLEDPQELITDLDTALNDTYAENIKTNGISNHVMKT